MRRRKKPGSVEKLLKYDDLVLRQPEEFKGKWKELFNNSNEIHMELGTGRGQFISKLAEQNPNINYIGVEIKEEIILKAVEKAEENSLKNIKFLWFDVNRIEEVFDKDEIYRIYINFCDPWPKKRWAKRRLTHRGFLQKYINILNKVGEIHFKTDNEQLFEFSLNELSAIDLKLDNISLDLHRNSDSNITTTEYEDKFKELGMKIYRCEAIKRV